MIRQQFTLDLNQELIVDNFAGGGGASCGIEMALGRHVDHAINHDWHALGMHRINHPQTIHHCEDIFDIDPATMCEGRPIGLAHFSPDCKHFSKAKGGKPLDKRIRGLVLIMLRYAKYGARVLTMENVEEIKTWGPLKRMLKNGEWGMYPDSDHRGRTWLAFLAILGEGIAGDHPDLPEILDVLAGTITAEECIRGFGYRFETRELRAFRYGTPTIRKRLYLIARNDWKPIVWPEPSHYDPGTGLYPKGQKPWRTIAECIDWDLSCPSIFLTRADARKQKLKCVRPLAKATLRRAAMGIDKYVLKASKPFLVSLTHQGGDRIESVDEPAKTLTAAHRGEKALVAPVLTEHANATHQRNFPADEPLRTQCGEVKGGHFAMVTGTLVGAGGRAAQSRPRGVDEPLHTTTSKADTCIAAASLVKLRGTNIGDAADKPVHTISAGGTHHGIIAASLAVQTTGHSGGHPDEPIKTIATGGHHSLVAASVVRHFSQSVGQEADKPAPTTVAGGGGKTGLIAAHLTKFNTGAVGQELTKPIATIPAGSHRPETHGGAATPHGLIAAHLAQANGGFNTNPGHDANEPVSTISGKGSQQQVVAASLTAYYGNDEDGQAITEPARVVTTKDRLGFVESLGVSPMTEDQIAGARRVAAFLREHGVQFEGEFAMVEGYVIVDIGMRMLTPRELFRAQGFPEDYVIDRAWVVDPKTGEVTEVQLTKEQQIRMCGNSVCRQVMAAIVRANIPELIVRYGDEKKGLVTA